MKFILDASTAVVYSSPRDAIALSKVGSIAVQVIRRFEVASALHQAILAKDLTLAEGAAIACRLHRVNIHPVQVVNIQPAPTHERPQEIILRSGPQAGRFFSPAHHVRSGHANIAQGQD